MENSENRAYIDSLVEIEKLKSELAELTPYKEKHLANVKADLLNGFKVSEELREIVADKLVGDSEEELREQAEKLKIDLRINNKIGADPSVRNPRNYMRSSAPKGGKDALREAGRAHMKATRKKKEPPKHVSFDNPIKTEGIGMQKVSTDTMLKNLFKRFFGKKFK